MNQKAATTVLVLAIAMQTPIAGAVGWDRDDFLVAGNGPGADGFIGVYDHDLTYKGRLASNFYPVAGLDFDAAGNLVAVSQNQQVRVYDSTGDLVSSFTSQQLVAALDIKVGDNGNYYVATQSESGLVEFDAQGSVVNNFDADYSRAVAALPGDELWVGGNGGRLGVATLFDTATREQIGEIHLENDRTRPLSMFYSSLTDTVLMSSNFFAPVEVRTDGTSVRSFEGAGNFIFGLTRGPDGDVYGTEYAVEGRIHRWTAEGEYLGSTQAAEGNSLYGIVWAGNIIPEPCSLTIVIAGSLAFCAARQRGLS